MKKKFSKIISGFAIFLAILFTAYSCASNKTLPKASENTEYTQKIKVEQGNVIGVYNNEGDVEIFAGIPYAKPPLGELRWREPQNPDKWDDDLIADTYAPMNMQKKSSAISKWAWNSFIMKNPKGDKSDKALTSEDCLYLNIWRPSKINSGEKLPVLVYIHGGSLVGGNSYSNLFEGENMAKNGIIQVNIDYRTGIFGFFANDRLVLESPNHTTGNYGILDQIKALEWIHNNIEAFGGDADNITIAGESAGSTCISVLCISPLAKGLFKNAIGESSSVIAQFPPHTFYTLSQSRMRSFRTMVKIGAASVDDMRNIPAEKLVKYTKKFNGVTIDGYAIPELPIKIYEKGQNNEKALLNGYNKNEGECFSISLNITKKRYTKMLKLQYPNHYEQLLEMYPASNNKEAFSQYSRLFTATAFGYPHYQWSCAANKNGVQVYEYYFTKENGVIGSNHGGEIVYAYGTMPQDSKHYDQSDYKLEDTMMSYWLNFIKTGNPNGTSISGVELPYWQSFNNDDTKIFELGSDVGLTDEPYLKVYPVMKSYIDTVKLGDDLHWDPREL